MRHLQENEDQFAISQMHLAAEVAKKALCKRAKCGTVIVADGLVIGEGYNAPPLDDARNCMCDHDKNHPGKPGYDQTCCMHAEWRAILDACRRNPEKIKGADLYFTRVDDSGNILKSGEPFCTVCSRFALDVGIRYFYLWQEEGVAQYPTDEYNRLSYEYRHPG